MVAEELTGYLLFIQTLNSFCYSALQTVLETLQRELAYLLTMCTLCLRRGERQNLRNLSIYLMCNKVILLSVEYAHCYSEPVHMDQPCFKFFLLLSLE